MHNSENETESQAMNRLFACAEQDGILARITMPLRFGALLLTAGKVSPGLAQPRTDLSYDAANT